MAFIEGQVLTAAELNDLSSKTDLASSTGSELIGIASGVSLNKYITRITPEMYGAVGDGSADDAPAIRLAMTAAIQSGVNRVQGDGVYKISSPITVLSGNNSSPAGLLPRLGFCLQLNAVIVDSTSWDAVPDKWWDATPAFKPGIDSENLEIHVNEFDGGGLATFISTGGSSLNTSRIHVGQARNYIIMFRNFLDMTSQSTMNYITGNNWEDGYIGVLIGGMGNGAGNSECHNINIQWCANQRYGGLSLQDRSQYTQVSGGTYNLNGKWTSAITLTNASSTDDYDIEFGDVISNGTVTGYALSSIMNNNGNQVLLLTESADKTDGVSDYKVGDTLTFGSWSATISAIALTSATNLAYFDLIISNRTDDYSKCSITPAYLGGFRGHNLFTNIINCANSVSTADAINYRGLGLAGGVDSSSWYLEHLYGDSAIFSFNKNNMTIGQTVQLGNNALYGSLNSFEMTIGNAVNIATFSAPANNLAYYTVLIGSSIQAQYAKALVRVDSVSVTIMESTVVYFTLATSGLNLSATINGSDAIVTVVTRREM